MIPLLESPSAQRLAWTLLHFLWQGALLGLAAWGGFALLRHRRPQLRYLVGCALLLACLGSALATFLALAPPVPVAGLVAGPGLLPGFPEPLGSSRFLAEAAPSLPALPWRARLQPYLPWILASWAAGVLILSLRAAGGWLWLRRLRAAAAPAAEPAWLGVLVRRVGLRRVVRFLESARVATPLCMGLLRPVVLLPLGFFANLDPLAAEAVLAHELAHLRRLDGLVNGLQCVIEVLFFFHPAVWWISRRIRTEREHCCDDAAVLACGDAVFYAETLSRLDALRDRLPTLALRARGGNLMERMRRLLLADPPRFRFATPGLAFLAAAALVGTIPAQAGKPLPPSQVAPAQATATVQFSDTPETLGLLRATPFITPARPAALPLRDRTASGLPLAPDQPAPSAPSIQAPVLPAELRPTDPPQAVPATGAAVSSGPRPTQAEALAFVRIMAEHALWGPRTEIRNVEVQQPTQWYAHLTARWPRGEDEGATLQGWEIRFWARPAKLLAPNNSFRERTILVDRHGVVHWRTLTEWDPLEPRPAELNRAVPPAPSDQHQQIPPGASRSGSAQPSPAQPSPFAGPEPTPEEAQRILQAFADQRPLGGEPGSTVLGVTLGRKQRWNGAYLGRWPEAPGKPPIFQTIKPIDGWVATFQLLTPSGHRETLTVLLDKHGVIHWRNPWPTAPYGLRTMNGKH